MSRQVAVNAVWNLFGVLLPILAGLVAVPMLLHGLGAARLGIFSLALGLLGFAGVFDLGLGRALTKTVASELGKGSTLEAIADLVRRGLLVVSFLGIIWGGLLWVGAIPVARGLFHLTGAFADETAQGVRWLAITLPVVLLSASLIGVLEGLQYFRSVNSLRAPIGAATFLVPAVIAQLTDNLGWVIAGLALTRAFGTVFFGVMVLHRFPLLGRHHGDSLDATAMWRFTGWLSVTNLVGPLMVYADRFYLASIFPPAVVAFYTVPLDTLSRATTLPSTAMNAAFPALARMGAQSQSQNIMAAAGRLMIGLWFVPLLLVAIWLESLLTLWLGGVFALQVEVIAQWLLAGVLFNGFAHIAYAALQSAGRSDLTAKLHVAELPLYALGLVALVSIFGITGAAIAWFARVFMDTVALYWMAMHQFSGLRHILSQVLAMALLGLLLLGLVFWGNHVFGAASNLWPRFALSVLVLVSTGWFLYGHFLRKRHSPLSKD